MLKKEKHPILISLYNTISNAFGTGSLLDFEAIIKKARRNTRLHWLGDDFNDEALRILIKSINQEAGLHPFGAVMIKEKLISQLENRLWAERWFKKYPEILEQELLPIALVTGLQRTGTTKMQRLLSGQPGARALYSWEALYPAPIGNQKETKKRKARTRRNELAVKWISPTFHSIHPIHTHKPEEDVLLLDVNFMSSSSEAIMHVPTYAAWLSSQDAAEVYRHEKKLLLLLQWQRSGGFWVLKSPHHLEHLDSFLSVFPKTKIVWMHRPLEQCIPSFLSMLYYSRSMFAKNVNKELIKAHWLPKFKNMLEAGIAFNTAHADKVYDVYFADFIREEQLVLGNVRDFLKGYGKRDGDFRQPQKEHYRSSHRYTLHDWGLSKAMVQKDFSFYDKTVFHNQI